MKPKFPPKAYTVKGGCRCPACGDERIEAQHVEVADGAASQDVTCTECGTTWTDLYKLTGYINLEIPE